MGDKELELLKKELKSVVISNPVTMRANDLNNDYKKMMGCYIPIQEFGHKDLKSFLRKECSDIFKFSGSENDPALVPIITKEVSHLNKLISCQKKPAKAKKERRTAVVNPTVKIVRTVNNNIQKENVKPDKQTYSSTLNKSTPKKGSVFSRLGVNSETSSTKCQQRFTSNRREYDEYFNSDDSFYMDNERKNPYFEYRSNREAYKNDFLELGDEIPIQPFRQSEREVVEINVCDVKNPWEFWFHLFDVELQGKLENLMCAINDFYFSSNDDHFIPLSKIEPQLYCVAIHRKFYHRAIILEIIDCSRIKVFYIDYGFVDIIEICDVRYLLRQFAHLPAQAIKGSQVGITPNRGRHWLLPAICEFVDLVRENVLLARIINKNHEIVEVDLKHYDIVRAIMIRRGYAKPCDI